MACLRGTHPIAVQFELPPLMIEEYLNPGYLYINANGVNIAEDPPGFERYDEDRDIIRMVSICICFEVTLTT